MNTKFTKQNLWSTRQTSQQSSSTIVKTRKTYRLEPNGSSSLLSGKQFLFFSTTLLLLYNNLNIIDFVESRDYYYSRTRNDPNHLRISEEFKNRYVDDVRYVSRINGTRYDYYISSRNQVSVDIGDDFSDNGHLHPANGHLSHDEMVFETIDKMFQHRLSPFYIHHYDNEFDKRRSFDTRVVSRQACARDLSYLIDRLPSKTSPKTPINDQINLQQDKTSSAPIAQHPQQHLTPELMALFDSYGRQEAGLFMGNIYWVGGYHQCINRHIFDLDHNSEHVDDLQQPFRKYQQSSSSPPLQDRDVVSFKGRYCVASIKAPIWDSIIAKRLQRGSKYFKTEHQAKVYSKLFRLQLGICLPDSCESTSLERHHDEIKMLATSMLDQQFAHYDLVDLYCLPDETSQLRQWSGSARNFLIFIGAWLVIILAATLADLCGFGQYPRYVKFVNWLSLIQNYNKLMAVKEQVETKDGDLLNVDLRFLNAFKALTMFWIINGHIMLLMIQTAKNILYSDALLNGLMHFLIGATFGVDLFFTMTGFLTAYLLFDSGHARKMRLGTWIYLTFHRYWRLAPMYILAFWFSRSVAQQLGSGPLWDYGTASLTFRGLCNHESWWYPLTLTSNLHGLFEECMITSWYISCDMQFWLVSPIFIHLLAKWPATGWVASIATILMSSKVRYDNILSEQTARYDELVQPRADIFMRVSHDLPALYTHPHHRIAAYIVGMLTGHYVYMVKSGRWRSSLVSQVSEETNTNEQKASLPTVTPSAESKPGNEPKVEQQQKQVTQVMQESDKFGHNKTRSLIGYTGLALFLMMAFVSYLLSQYYPNSMLKYSKEVASYAFSIDHLLMSLGFSFVIVAMCFGQWPTATKFLSHPNWTRLSKINYALLLLQCEAIYFQIFRYDQVPIAGTRELVNILFNLLVTLYPAAFLVTLAVEFPLANMEKMLV